MTSVIAPASRTLSRSITVTWWYTASAVMFFQCAIIFFWTATAFALRGSAPDAALVALGGLVWLGATVPLLVAYRARTAESSLVDLRLAAAVFVVAFAYGGILFAVLGAWIVLVAPALYFVILLNWPPKVRLRVVGLVTVVLLVLWLVDGPNAFTAVDGELSQGFGFFTVALPAMTVLSLWWWDVLITVDRARASEARLAATQERLRVATDVHDLQGHHLQVIALQLELAERLMDRDPDAALEQLRLARTSVDAARQGTRDLATRFRSVPLRDELANAADLLRAAGTTVDLHAAPDADLAPTEVLGPIIRETTTNVLRHGDGARVGLSLGRDGGAWRYEITNDAAGVPSADDGSGLDGIRRRAADVGGTVEVTHESGVFAVIVRIPEAVVA